MLGSVEVGKIADLVLWEPAFFGAKPKLVIKNGVISWARDGRSERIAADAAAGLLPADVRRLRRGVAGHLHHLRLGSRACGRGQAAPGTETVR